VTTVREDKLADSTPKQTAPKQPLALALGAAAVTVTIILGVLAGPSAVNCFNGSESMGLCLKGKMRNAGLLPGAEIAVAETAPVTRAAAGEQIEPELDVASVDAAQAAPENLIAATFGLLRAEPDGSVVIAGSGTPGSEIEVYSSGELLGKTTVEASGGWVLVPEIRIAPGGTEITLGEAGKEGLAPQSFFVAINQDKSSEPLVVASTPGAVSEVLQGLPQASADNAHQIAVVDTDAPAAISKPATIVPPAQAPAVAEASSAPAIVTAPAPTTAVQPPDEAAVAAAAVAKTDAAAEPAATPAEPAMAVATAEPAVVAAPAPAAVVPVVAAAPTIDAVEVDGDKTFFAGSGANGATVRLYVDEVFIVDTTIADGRWLIEAGKVLTKPDQRVRVDMLQPGSAAAMSRAEIDFHIDLPATAEPAAPANESAAIAQATSQPEPESAAPADAAATDSAAPAVPSIVTVTIGNLDDQRFAAGKAIIRRGDNLWTIARRVYGEGVKYPTLYQANTDQIRDPDRIYPGQVFNLPESSVN
ncbi:MAG: LysM peptidoglycan-binding domain-containing protein, partial [Candidatus Devosia euplotis]|nr:LysM peptidoglycan-binding domain-containing protein [Candidatus Devosia euplotis]